LICPKCKTRQLHRRPVKGRRLTVDVCPSCTGIWFDADELAAAMGEAGEPVRVPRQAKRASLCCPRCKEPLYSFLYPQTRVTVESCKRCGGFWLDAGEFQAIRQARQYLQQVDDDREERQAGTIKQTLLDFIDNAIATLLE
jgi:uncharacterized protein